MERADSGILPAIPGHVLGAASALCPDASTALSDVHEVVIDVPGIGTVAVTVRLHTDPRWRRRFWTPSWAVLVK